MVAEALDLLVTDASRVLQDLSAGQYSFVFDEANRDFLVVDHRNADERRSVRTLSGGETFQAALALALALSDQLGELAANGAARLESIFLDEGFGTLDPDTLDAVASTIENLAVGDRMVGLVTHVAALSDRVPVRYVVSKGPRTATVDKVLT
jgi:exonuclease SbcC